MRPIIAPLALLALAAQAQAQTPSFTRMGVFPTGRSTWPTAVSADGSVVVGYGNVADGSSFASQPMRWTAATGVQPLAGLAYPHGDGWAFGVSADGSTVAGTARIDFQGYFSNYRWTSAGGPQVLDTSSGSARGVNADGTVIVGNLGSGSAFIWTQGGGEQVIPNPPDTSGGALASVSADGGVAAGYLRQTGHGMAVRWTSSVGYQDLAPGNTDASASAISADGQVIVGRLTVSPTDFEAFRWTQTGGAIPLGHAPGDPRQSAALGVSGDGSIVVGTLGYGGGQANLDAFIWTSSTGMVDLKSYLLNLGLTDVSPFRLWEATAVSADGTTIVGYCSGIGDTGFHGFVAHIPAPAGWAPMLLTLLLPRRRRRA